MNQFTVNLASPPDRKRLVAEVFYGLEQIAELRHETLERPVELELYTKPNGHPWCVEVEAFLAAVSEARTKLLERLPRGEA